MVAAAALRGNGLEPVSEATACLGSLEPGPAPMFSGLSAPLASEAGVRTGRCACLAAFYVLSINPFTAGAWGWSAQAGVDQVSTDAGVGDEVLSVVVCHMNDTAIGGGAGSVQLLAEGRRDLCPGPDPESAEMAGSHLLADVISPRMRKADAASGRHRLIWSPYLRGYSSRNLKETFTLER